jgi:hypothetical protein
MDNTATEKVRWKFWRRSRRRKNDPIQGSPEEPPEVTRSGRRAALFERVEVCAALLVVVSILAEDWDILPTAICDPTSKDGIKAIAGICVAVFIAVEILFSQLAKKHDGIVQRWYAKRVAELNLARAKIEEKLRSTLGPRIIDPEQLDHMANLFRQMFSGTKVIVFVCPQTNSESQKEGLDFAFQLSAVFDAQVYSRDRLDWEVPEDIVVIPARTGSDDSRSAAARGVFNILRMENFPVHGPIPIVLQHDLVFRYGRNFGGTGFLTAQYNVNPKELEDAVWIVVGKRSQPVLRLDS